MKKITTLIVMLSLSLSAFSQTVLSLDSCRAMALRNNKQLNATKLKQDIAVNVRKTARTKYLPKVDVLGGYHFMSKEVSVLNNDQKAILGSLGTSMSTAIGGNITNALTGLASNGLISPQTAKELGTTFETLSPALSSIGDTFGQNIKEAFRTDTRNIWAGSVMLRQPIFMGGAIVAANKMADISEQMALTEIDGKTQNTIYSIDETYWLVVSLKQKKNLAESYRDLVQKLNDDVHKMIDQGFATRADGLKVDVKVNEADMQVTQADNGLTLAKMLLCQLCGIPVDSNITLADENNDNLNVYDDTADLPNTDIKETRPEIKMLNQAVELSKQSTKLIRAEYLPHLALTGGYMISNPNTFNGFEKKFSGVWNVGVVMQIPVWNWFESSYKIKASKTATTIASLEMNDAIEKVNLQVEQSRFKVTEANKRLIMATRNVANAEENLRCANVGFKEGVMESTDVMTAQTAWQSAKSQKIDAEIDVKLAQVALKKALGVLQ
jgi:outer membrane protein TolC